MKNWSPVKIYFTFVSIVSIIRAIIAGGATVYTLFDKVLISDEEYLVGGNRSYEITQCEQPAYKNDQTVEKTPDEIAACKADATQRVLVARSYEFKSDLIMGAVRLIICVSVYGFHYRKLKSYAQETEIN